MSHDPVKVRIFGLGLLVRREHDDGSGTPEFHARAVYEADGISASLTTLVALQGKHLEDLLQQIEAQYGDFRKQVVWGSVDTLLEVRWQLDELGRATGRVRLEDPARGWRLDASLAGDQSYLPQMALGLRLLLRPEA